MNKLRKTQGSLCNDKRALIDTFCYALARKYRELRMVSCREIGLCRRGRRRADFLALSMKREIVIVECKSCVQDFRSDHKWTDYLRFCNKFYFCFSPSLWESLKGEIPSGIGVYVCDTENRKLRVVKRASRRTLDDCVLNEVLVRIAYRQAKIGM